jgi:hypothetical protein
MRAFFRYAGYAHMWPLTRRQSLHAQDSFRARDDLGVIE